jgi:hypothetical protein
MTGHPVLLLLGATPWEGPFVAGLAHPSSRVAIERRCLDTADLLACAESGLGRVAIVGADAPRVDADVVARLRRLGVRPPTVRAAPVPPRRREKVGRNELCPCGSGQKYKRCHGKP